MKIQVAECAKTACVFTLCELCDWVCMPCWSSPNPSVRRVKQKITGQDVFHELKRINSFWFLIIICKWRLTTQVVCTVPLHGMLSCPALNTTRAIWLDKNRSSWSYAWLGWAGWLSRLLHAVRRRSHRGVFPKSDWRLGRWTFWDLSCTPLQAHKIQNP